MGISRNLEQVMCSRYDFCHYESKKFTTGKGTVWVFESSSSSTCLRYGTFDIANVRKLNNPQQLSNVQIFKFSDFCNVKYEL